MVEERGMGGMENIQMHTGRRGILTFEDFILALIIISIATALIISNLFIFDHRTVEQMGEQHKVWAADIAADTVAKKYVDGKGELELGALNRPLPENIEIMVGELRFGATPPVATNIYASTRLVFVNGQAQRMTVKTW